MDVSKAKVSGATARRTSQFVGVTVTLYAAVPTRKHLPARTRAFVDFLLRSFGDEDRDPWLDGAGAGAG